MAPRLVPRPEQLEEWVDSEVVYADGDGEGSSDEAVVGEILRKIERVRSVEVRELWSEEEGESEDEGWDGEALEMVPRNFGRALDSRRNAVQEKDSAPEPFPDFYQPSYTPSPSISRQSSRIRLNNDLADEQILADVARIASHGVLQPERSLARETYDALFDDEGNNLDDDNDSDNNGGEAMEE